MIAVVDSGVANLASVVGALGRLGAMAEVTSNAAIIAGADRVILPGVGSAAAAMARLRQDNLVDSLRALTQPVLGICLGMQLLFTRTEESGGIDGIGVIPGEVKRLEPRKDVRIPHMGWNTLRTSAHPLLAGVDEGAFVYFVHSYAAPVGTHTLAACTHGAPFSAISAAGNFIGCQFHPERSGAVGSQILHNFLSM